MAWKTIQWVSNIYSRNSEKCNILLKKLSITCEVKKIIHNLWANDEFEVGYNPFMHKIQL